MYKKKYVKVKGLLYRGKGINVIIKLGSKLNKSQN
jgi:hypothetical protein